jgi:hypothetical protein
MHRWLRDLALCFAAGAAGAVAKGLLVWICSYTALTAPIGSYLAMALYPLGFYPRVVWGGLYGFLFLLPPARGSSLMSGLLWGGVVSLLQLLILPLWQHSGLHWSLTMVLSTALLNCIWGCATALLLRSVR